MNRNGSDEHAKRETNGTSHHLHIALPDLAVSPSFLAHLTGGMHDSHDDIVPSALELLHHIDYLYKIDNTMAHRSTFRQLPTWSQTLFSCFGFT